MSALLSPRRFFRLVRRDGADRYLIMVLLGFVGSVTLTRLFLSLTNYPKIGGGELHIAHALWGGLLLFIAAILPLILANRRVFSASALIGGIGVGLFIDEVGKFITTSNDYFYPAAASIVYIFFLLSILFSLRYTRPPSRDSHAELSRALECVQESLRYPLTARQKTKLEEKLTFIAEKDEDGEFARLARNLLSFVRHDVRSAPERRRTWYDLLIMQISAWVSTRRLRAAVLVLLAGLSLISFKNPLSILLLPWTGGATWIDRLLQVSEGRHIEIATDPDLASIRMTLEVCVGSLYLIAVVLLLLNKNKRGTFIAFTGLLVSFFSTNILVFYFEQFSTVIMVGFQFAALLALIEYRRRLTAEPSLSPVVHLSLAPK